MTGSTSFSPGQDLQGCIPFTIIHKYGKLCIMKYLEFFGMGISLLMAIRQVLRKTGIPGNKTSFFDYKKLVE
jgi:hypothetical protein